MKVRKRVFKSPAHFFAYNRERLRDRYFFYYHLHNLEIEIMHGKTDCYDAFNIENTVGDVILVLIVSKAVYLYSKSWEPQMLEKAASCILKFHQEIKVIRGSHEIVSHFASGFCKMKEEINKRVVFECKSLKAINFSHGILTKKSSEFQNQFIDLFKQSYFEAFKGKGSMSLQDQEKWVRASVNQGLLWGWLVDNQIVSMAYKMNSDEQYAIISGVFTNPSNRNKGYASNLLFGMTRYYLNNGYQSTGLLTNASNKVAIRCFEKIGYQPICMWMNLLVGFEISDG